MNTSWWCPDCKRFHKCQVGSSVASACSTDEQAEVEQSENQMRSAEAQAVERLLDEIDEVLDSEGLSFARCLVNIGSIVDKARNRLRENRC